MIRIFFQLNADKDSYYLLRETTRRTVSPVGFWFDGLPPKSVSGVFRIRTGHTREEE